MLRLFALIFALSAQSAAAQSESEVSTPLDLPHAECAEGQWGIPDVAGQRIVCYWPSDEPRFGCPDDWILTQRGGEFVSCRPQVEQPEPTQIELPEPPSFCDDDQVISYSTSGPQCAPRFDDAGQDCGAAFECEGTCLADENTETTGRGVCAAGPLSFGCTDFLGPLGDVISICID